jgi:hypothetical protein
MKRMDLDARIRKHGEDYDAAVRVADQIIDDPNIRGYLIDLVFLLCRHHGTMTHPQDLLAVLLAAGGDD